MKTEPSAQIAHLVLPTHKTNAKTKRAIFLPTLRKKQVNLTNNNLGQ